MAHISSTSSVSTSMVSFTASGSTPVTAARPVNAQEGLANQRTCQHVEST